MARKLSLLNLLCNFHGMIINMKKTYFFAVNAGVDERSPFYVDGKIIILEVFPQATVAFHNLLLHRHRPICHFFLFVYLFLVKKNADIIFYVERKLFETSHMSASLGYVC